MAEQQFIAHLNLSQGRNIWCIVFRHPLRMDSQGHRGFRVRCRLGTSDLDEAGQLKDQMNELLSDQVWWTPAARESADRIFDSRIVSAFYDHLIPQEYDFWSIRENIIPLPTPDDGYTRVLFVGTTGAGKTTVVRQLLGTTPTERFPSTSTAKTTICDLEVVLAEGGYKAVVSFLPEDRIQMYVEECVIAAVLAALEQRDQQDVVRKLLEHNEQRFRLSYVLGTLPASLDEDEDEFDAEEDDEREDTSEQDILSFQDRQKIVATLQGYFQEVQLLAMIAHGNLETLSNFENDVDSKEDSDARVQEWLENELYKYEPFQKLVDDIVDAIEERFSFLQKGFLALDQGEWPSYWTFETEDREEFLKTIRQFSSNYAPLFGRLLTPLVQGIRIVGPFYPTWRGKPAPRLVLIDGEGLGHTLDTAVSLSTDITSRFEKADAIVLVDSASQPMQAAPDEVLKSVEASGHTAKLLICFTHFDAVEGDNLPDQQARRNHVFSSLENAISAIGKEMGLRASAALSIALRDRVFFVSKIQKPLSQNAKATRAEFNRMVDAIEATKVTTVPTEVRPVYDDSDLRSFVRQAVKSFHREWQIKLGITTHSRLYPEHWTRIKALSRRPAQLNMSEYDSLKPVADLIRDLIEQIRLFLDEPLKWEPSSHVFEEVKQAAIDSIAREIYTQLHTLAHKRLIGDRHLHWEIAYYRRGTGSTLARAHEIQLIYNLGAPLIGETDDDDAEEFLMVVIELVRKAVRANGGRFR